MDICYTWYAIKNFCSTNLIDVKVIRTIDAILSRLLYHFIRDSKNDNFRVKSIEKTLENYISKNLNFTRKIIFKMIIKNNKIDILDKIEHNI